MSQSTMSIAPSLEEYTFDLRSGLRDAAKAGLTQLEQLINDVGYGWLDGYMEGITERADSRAPITELMKTPSRTVSKKTRNATTAAKKRTATVKKANQQLAESPHIQTQKRQPFSPLSPRHLNAPTEVSASPLKGKGSPAPVLKKSTRGKGKKKAKENEQNEGEEAVAKPKKTKAVKDGKGKEKTKKIKSKKAVEADPTRLESGISDVDPMDEHVADAGVEHGEGSMVVEDGHLKGQYTDEEDMATTSKAGKHQNTKSTTPESSKQSTGASRTVLEPESKEEVQMDTGDALDLGDQLEDIMPGSFGDMPKEDNSKIDIEATDTIADQDVTETLDKAARSEDDRTAIKREGVVAISPVTVHAALPTPPLPTPSETTTLPFDFPTFTSQPTTAKKVSNEANVPVRQVRSSWLSKALGTGTVPVASSSNNDTRKSTLNQQQMRTSLMNPAAGMRKSSMAMQRPHNNLPSMPIDFAAARKSLVQPGTLGAKRKSGEGIEEEHNNDETTHEDERAPSKISKVEVPVPETTEEDRPIFSISRKISTSGHTANIYPTTTPGNPTVPRASTSRERVDGPRSDIHKVTRALEELRERTAAKEAKAKAALASSTGPSGGHTVSFDARPSTGQAQGGLLRGLGSLGAGLSRSLGLGKDARSAEDEALRLQKELEEEERAEREAQEELERLLGEEKGKKAGKDAALESAKEEQMDEADEEDVNESIQEIEEREAPMKQQVASNLPPVNDKRELKAQDTQAISTTPQRPPAVAAARATILSTTPMGTPPRSLNAMLNKLKSVPAQEAKVQQKAASTTHEPILTTSPERTGIDSKPARPAKSPERALHTARQVQQASSPTSPVPKTVRAPPVTAKSPKRPQSAIKSNQQFGTTRVAETDTNPTKKAEEPSVRVVSAARSEPEESDGTDSESEADVTDLPEPVESEDDHSDPEEEDEPPVNNDVPAKKMFKSEQDTKQPSRPNFTKSTSTYSLATSASSTSILSHASIIAGKSLGFKPTTGPVKSLQLAAAAAKKEQAGIDKKIQVREQIEQRKAEIAKKKAEEDRLKAEEERKIRVAELEERKKQRAILEKARKEREEKAAIIAKEKQARKDEEAAAVARIKAEEEASRKRKLAQAAAKAPAPPAKKVALSGANSSSSNVVVPPRPKEQMRIVKPTPAAVNSSVNGMIPTKNAGSSFRSAPGATVDASIQQTTSSVTLVQTNGERKPLGPPSRPSQQPTHAIHAVQTQQYAHAQASNTAASSVLQQSRVALQTQMEIKAIEVQSEDIDLPDIASEYSDSDDSEKEDDFKRPQWAESPELRAALERQAYRDPDELFGPIKPVNMEELFKARANKFRPRSSSANWGGGDRLTRTEEIEYARRMGFKPIAGGRSGSSTGAGQP